jgi:glycosyltransferase involved in cell wall biosynthesis
MRLAYLLDWKFGPESGVGKKIVDQIANWNRFGIEVTLFISCPAEHADAWARLPFRVRTHTYTHYISRLNARNLSLQNIVDEKNEVIYTRFGILSPFTIRRMKKIPTILELNTKGLLEYKRRSLFLYLYAVVTSKIILNNSIAICAITPEVANEAERIAGNELNYEVFPNSIDLNRFRNVLPPKNRRPKLVFVGSPGLVWHGMDRLSELARKLSEYDFYVIGPNEGLNRPSNMEFVGEIFDDELNEFLEGMDIAISSLALDRNMMSEGSPIKTRLYLALGLPVVIGYTDTGLGKGSDYIFKISPDEWPIADERINELRDFVSKNKGRRVPRQEIFSIDSQVVEKKRVDFIIKTSHQKVTPLQRLMGPN